MTLPALPTLAAVPAQAAPVDERDVQAERILVNRYRKARKCAKVLVNFAAYASDAEQILATEAGRKLVAQAADCNVPSVTTCALIVEIVRECERP